MSDFDPYKVLQVDPEAEDEVIQAAYRRLARKYHPGRRDGSATSQDRMVRINQAWDRLRDPVRRAAVDRARPPATPPRTSPPPTPMRTSATGCGRAAGPFDYPPRGRRHP